MLSENFAPLPLGKPLQSFHGAQRGSKTVLIQVKQIILFERYDPHISLNNSEIISITKT
jgi:hypothetical protein